MSRKGRVYVVCSKNPKHKQVSSFEAALGVYKADNSATRIRDCACQTSHYDPPLHVYVRHVDRVWAARISQAGCPCRLISQGGAVPAAYRQTDDAII